jgi:hypothetical protein
MDDGQVEAEVVALRLRDILAKVAAITFGMAALYAVLIFGLPDECTRDWNPLSCGDCWRLADGITTMCSGE